MIENLDELLVQVQDALDTSNEVLADITDGNFVAYDEADPLGKQIKDVEATIANLQDMLTELNNAYNVFNHVLGSEIQQVYQTELFEMRQRYLEEETDTPREAAENIEKVLPMVSDPIMRGQLQAALKYLMTQVPPTTEELEDIPFETARIDDANLDIGTEIVEVKGVLGQVKVIYETIDDEQIEVERTVVKEPVTAVVRVGTRVVDSEPTE